MADLHNYRDTCIVEYHWGELGMSECLPLVPGERGEHGDSRYLSFSGWIRGSGELLVWGKHTISFLQQVWDEVSFVCVMKSRNWKLEFLR